MNLLQDVLTYIRRFVKTPSNAVISDNLLIDYVNRFWMMDVDARIQLFDLKKKYQFLTVPGVDRYNMPLYDIQTEPGSQTIASFPVYQGFLQPALCNGTQMSFSTNRNEFNLIWPNYVQRNLVAGYGDGGVGPYTLNLPFLSNYNNFPSVTNNFPLNASLIRGHIDTTGIIALGNNIDPPIAPTDGSTIDNVPTTSVSSAVYFTSTAQDGSNIVVADSGQFLSSNRNCGLLMQPGNAPYGNLPLTNGPAPFYSETQNTINYITGVAQNVYFPNAIPAGMPINASAYYFQLGMPTSVLFYNNTLTLRSPPNTQYVIELDGYLSPAAFLNTGDALPFGYMAEYLALGAARKLMYDTGDSEQLQFYEGLFREQESLVHIRSQRQWTSTRVQTIYSGGCGGANYGSGYGSKL